MPKQLFIQVKKSIPINQLRKATSDENSVTKIKAWQLQNCWRLSSGLKSEGFGQHKTYGAATVSEYSLTSSNEEGCVG